MDDIWKHIAGWLWAPLAFLAAWVFNKQDSRLSAVEKEKATSKTADELKDSLHNLRNRAVTVEALKDRKDEVDRRFAEHDELLRARRDDVRELHGRIDGLKDAMNEGFMETQRLILERLPRP